MSVSTVQTITGRLESATRSSPIAVFRLGKGKAKFDAVFANTVVTQARLMDKASPLILGVFDKYSIRKFKKAVADL